MQVCLDMVCVPTSEQLAHLENCSLVMGRLRVPPSKVTTTPRLELSAAVVAVCTGDMLKKELQVELSQETYWTDSKVVLGYIGNEARRFRVFVANRIERIKQNTESTQWRYVASEENPADHASRGLTAEKLVATNWFKGPDLLWQKVVSSSEVKVGELSSSDPEVKKVQVLKTQVKEDRSLLEHFHKLSDWSRMIKAVARLRGLAKEIKEHNTKSCEISNLEERKEAELTVIKLVQETAVSHEIKCLQQHEVIEIRDKVNKLHKLSPFLDNQGILHVGQRLKHAALHSNIKFPAIMPRDSHVSMLLAKHCHEKSYHQGRGITTNELRANGYWILGCSKVVSSQIYRCIRCRKFRRRTEQQKNGRSPRRSDGGHPTLHLLRGGLLQSFLRQGRKEGVKARLLVDHLYVLQSSAYRDAR